MFEKSSESFNSWGEVISFIIFAVIIYIIFSVINYFFPDFYDSFIAPIINFLERFTY
jgi:hypothetical protein